MKLIEGLNVNDVYASGVKYLLESGSYEYSRNGRVLVAPGPVMSIYRKPRERVLFNQTRDANPFFHLMEAIWMLSGSKCSDWPTLFNKQMGVYASPDGTYDGAYGYRWRRQFGFDQIKYVVEQLKDDPETRRAVIAMYAPDVDNNPRSLDIPCNTHIYFDCRHGALNMTVCCRSNDAIWGAYGANVVHMSVLQEVVAAGVGIPVGEYRQLSNNFHLYPDVPRIAACLTDTTSDDLYRSCVWNPYPIVSDFHSFLTECEEFVKNPESHRRYSNDFFYFVARPMYLSWMAHKAGLHDEAMSWAEQIESMDWTMACCDWLLRRNK